MGKMLHQDYIFVKNLSSCWNAVLTRSGGGEAVPRCVNSLPCFLPTLLPSNTPGSSLTPWLCGDFLEQCCCLRYRFCRCFCRGSQTCAHVARGEPGAAQQSYVDGLHCGPIVHCSILEKLLTASQNCSCNMRFALSALLSWGLWFTATYF